MRIGIMSDSHGNTMAVDQAIQKAGQVDVWLHAGDLIQDAEYLSIVTGKEVIHVAGNCDWPQSSVPEEILIEKAGHKIFLSHGHIYGVKRGNSDYYRAALAKGADVAIYGHTHVAEIDEKKNCLMINPGSVSHPRDGQAQSFMVLNLQGQEIKVEHFHI